MNEINLSQINDENLTDEQIDKLQAIYDKEIVEKQNKIKLLKQTNIKRSSYEY